MVDELELLKKDWQKQEATLPKLTKADIYPMLLKKSSSVVKWILIVSVIEFAFWILLTFGIKLDGEGASNVESAIGSTVEIISTVIHLTALLFFVGWFYKNYKKIESTDSPKDLMYNILKTRKTVKYYIWFNIAFLVVGSIAAFTIVEINSPDTIVVDNLLIAALAFIAIVGIFIGLLLLFYRLIYGILLRRLKTNYDELKKMDY
ncbi:hypothetical protein EAX61_01110 [Dokdonia sinensis]|uniref:Beta-carotene 15,15'-monooxygenase n=1 Tax=Dokdonia sinensis TaxID=2479847 RepID=A0A3M0GH67_9FLAO|nr:hypothetical protein [Dokdonia sinensis]RMB64010.1 hypothetical protein EAX61_01110 [Dokdonia sinensis]